MAGPSSAPTTAGSATTPRATGPACLPPPADFEDVPVPSSAAPATTPPATVTRRVRTGDRQVQIDLDDHAPPATEAARLEEGRTRPAGPSGSPTARVRRSRTRAASMPACGRTHRRWTGHRSPHPRSGAGCREVYARALIIAGDAGRVLGVTLGVVLYRWITAEPAGPVRRLGGGAPGLRARRLRRDPLATPTERPDDTTARGHAAGRLGADRRARRHGDARPARAPPRRLR